MSNPQNIAISDYDYPLPEDRIAKFPLAQRDHSKLLMFDGNDIHEHHFYNLPQLLPANSLLVFNNTKVIHARLLFHKTTGAQIEIFCLEPYLMPATQSFNQRERCSWICLIGNNKKWKSGPLTLIVGENDNQFTLTANRGQAVGESWVVEFCWDNGASFAEIIERAGIIPLPPYLNRDAEQSDNDRYQTIYARYDGSVAAPTAGLHFTDAVFDQLRQRHVDIDYITLHVGAGTFKPVNTVTIGQHEMHVEQVEIGRQNIECILHHLGRPIIPVGTTSVRTIESIYWFGVQLSQDSTLSAMHIHQWDPYTLESVRLSATEAYQHVLDWMEQNHLDTLDGDTQLLIAPGYHYHIVSGLITNFHMPKSTLLLLVSALIGDAWRECYRYALSHDFRFLSYGDSCLFLPQPL